MAGHFVEPAMLIPQILICSLQLGFDCYCERKATIKPHGIQCAFLRMLTLLRYFNYFLDAFLQQQKLHFAKHIGNCNPTEELVELMLI